jgi:uroporphyrinogen decarboxylase
MLLLDALSLNATPRKPVWIMRQAGRYMKAFRDVRAKHSFLEVCNHPELALNVSLLPLKAYAVDAAIVFSDILIPLQSLGATIDFPEGGPVVVWDGLNAPLPKRGAVEDYASGILSTLKLLRKEVPSEKAVLGFAGAPFTMMAYLVEGKLTKDLSRVKTFMYENPQKAHEILDHLSLEMGDYLEAQVNAGADAVQLFDTWAGMLSPSDYDEFALPYARKVLSHVTAPSLYYVNGVSGVLDSVASVGAQGLSIDWRMKLSEARRRVSQVTALQGNLDPYALHLPAGALRQRVLAICEDYGRKPGHIFNLGHGIVPSVPEDSLKVVIEAVHEFG